MAYLGDVETQFGLLAKLAGIVKHVRGHAFRHSFATLLKGNGEDVEIARGSLRHADSKVTLDVYTQVWRTAKDYTDRRGSVCAWLLTMARSRAIDHVRSRASRTRREEPFQELTQFRSTEPGPDREIEMSQRRRRVMSALDTLPPEQREAIELAFFSGLTHAELAVRLKQPLGTVKTRVRQGMMKIRELLVELR